MNQGEHLEDWVDYRERADLQVGYVKSEILNYLRENKAETQEAVEQEERLDMEALTSGKVSFPPFKMPSYPRMCYEISFIYFQIGYNLD